MAWSFLIQGGNQIINFIVSVILARILLPSEFGLIGMIAIFIIISKEFVNGGFSSSLIRTKIVDNRDYSTIFFVNIIASLLLYVVLFLLAPYVTQFYEEPILTNLIRVLGLILLVSAFSFVQSTKLNKELDFKTQFKLQLPALILSASISIWMANNGYGVWSLVIRNLSYAVFATLQLWFYSNWKPSLIFDKRKLKHHFNFGYKLSLTQIMNTLFSNLYNIIIGKFYSAAQLGFYTRSKSLVEMPSGFFVSAFNRVAYPLLSSIGDDHKKLKSVYSRLMKMLVFIITPLLIYLGIIAEPLIKFLLTEKWLPAVPYFQFLIISGLFYPIHKYNLNICKVIGRSDLVLKLSMFENILLLFGALSAIWYGIYGLLYSIIVVNILVTSVNAFFSGKLINYGLFFQIRDLYPSFLIAGITGFVTFYISTKLLFEYSDILKIFISGIIYASFYLSISLLMKVQAIQDFKSLIKKN
jgi:O-antigen/teichoic acid export membrane protein